MRSETCDECDPHAQIRFSDNLNMASCFHSFFDGCISRSKAPSSSGKSPPVLVAPYSSPIEDLRSLPSVTACETLSPYSSAGKPPGAHCFPELHRDEDHCDGSIGSTSPSVSSPVDTAATLLSQMKCALCREKSTGFCVGCPRERYCSECYHRTHQALPKTHRFVSYSANTAGHTRLTLAMMTRSRNRA